MNPNKYNLDLTSGNPLYQGSSFNLTITATTAAGAVYPLTGFMVKAQIRRDYVDAEPALIFAVTQAATAAASAGTVSISAASGQTAALAHNGRYVWDMVLDNGAGTVNPFLYGEVQVLPRVTR